MSPWTRRPGNSSGASSAGKKQLGHAYVWENKLRTEIVTIGTNKARSYDLDGKVLWELSGTSGLVARCRYPSTAAISRRRLPLRTLYAVHRVRRVTSASRMATNEQQVDCWSQPRVRAFTRAT